MEGPMDYIHDSGNVVSRGDDPNYKCPFCKLELDSEKHPTILFPHCKTTCCLECSIVSRRDTSTEITSSTGFKYVYMACPCDICELSYRVRILEKAGKLLSPP